MTTMRSLDETGAPSRLPGATGWAEHRDAGPLVIFGHDAVRGLQRHARAIGLDTGCCYGGRLTAVYLPDRTFVDVPARRMYAKPAYG